MTEKLFFRQGDILFELMPEGKGDMNIEKLDSKTVALGEITGHHHSFGKKDQVLLYKEIDSDVPTNASLQAPSTITHQEHLSIQLPKGEYKIKREQSYNPFLKQIQRSMD